MHVSFDDKALYQLDLFSAYLMHEAHHVKYAAPGIFLDWFGFTERLEKRVLDQFMSANNDYVDLVQCCRVEAGVVYKRSHKISRLRQSVAKCGFNEYCMPGWKEIDYKSQIESFLLW